MASKYLYHVICASSMLGAAYAQGSKIVPQDLQGGFQSSGTDLQVSYTNDAVNGFTDGTTFDTQAVAKAPTFALGDSSGIVASARYTLLMVDTTCDNARALHFAQTNFKYNFDITNLESAAKPVLDYKAPGSLKETGDGRKYSFLMYEQPGDNEISTLKLPADGAVFDAKKFQSDNSFDEPDAGLGMQVKLGGTANCNGAPSNGGGAASSAAPQQSSQPSQTAKASAPAVAPSGSAPAPSAPQSSGSPATGAPAPAKPSLSGAAQSTAAVSEAPASSQGSAQTSAPDAASSVLASAPALPTSTVFLTSVAPDKSGSATGTGSPALQTTSGASGLSLMTSRWVLTAFAVAVAGFLAI